MRVHYLHEGAKLCGVGGASAGTDNIHEVNCPTCIRDIEEMNEDIEVGEGYN